MTLILVFVEDLKQNLQRLNNQKGSRKLDRVGVTSIFTVMKSTAKRLSLAEIKAKAGKVLLNVESIKGGAMSGCHIEPMAIEPPIVRTDNA